KRKSVVVDAGEALHPPKKLREDHGTLSGTSVGGKYMSTLKGLLVRAVLNAEVGVAAIPTLPFMTTSISTTRDRDDGSHTDSMARLNLRATRAPPRFVISSDSSHHSGTNVAEAEVNSLVRYFVLIMTTVTTITLTIDPTAVAKEKLVEPSSFCDGSSSAGGTDPTTGGFLDLTALFTEFNVKVARQMSLSAEVRICVEYNVKEKNRETKATEAIRLRAQASNFEAVEKFLQDETNALKERNAILEKERNALDVKVTDLEASDAGKDRELTDFNALITSVKSQIDNLVDRVRAFILRAAIGKAIEKGMQDGLSAGIVHGKERRVLTDVTAHNPYAKVNYTSALQQLRNLNFSLLAKLKSNKDASVETVMVILCMEGPLVEKLRLNELQPDVGQLLVHIHRSSNKVVLGA
nr:nonaspanin [Tanacetum cinerariifolium]